MNMDGILDLVTRELIAVLAEALPPLSDDWWNLYVLDQLTSNQARHLGTSAPALESLDLAAALRVLTRNFIIISTKRGLSRDCKNFAFQVLDIRNRHAHRSMEAIAAEDRYRDLDTLERFVISIKAPDTTISSIRERKQAALIELREPALAQATTTIKVKAPDPGNQLESDGTRVQLSKKEAISLLRKVTNQSVKSREVTFSNVNATSGNWWFEPAVTAFEQDRFFLLNDQANRVLYAFSVPAKTFVPPDEFFYVRPDSNRCQIYVSPSDTDHFADIHPSGPKKVRFSEYLLRRIPY